ncbi:MAG: hypothetical protein KDA81_16350 [Planctomycetaceae bacterium]|nr:hypothetical protein [Planctomycetaceae bacterium]
MLEAPTIYQQRIWVLGRLHRICEAFRSRCRSEPCLEQYEQQVAQMMDEPVTAAASAWIAIIAQCLRSEAPFHPEEYMTVK